MDVSGQLGCKENRVVSSSMASIADLTLQESDIVKHIADYKKSYFDWDSFHQMISSKTLSTPILCAPLQSIQFDKFLLQRLWRASVNATSLFIALQVCFDVDLSPMIYARFQNKLDVWEILIVHGVLTDNCEY